MRPLVDGAASYSVAHGAGLLPTEPTGMWGWILLRSPHRGRGSPQSPHPLSKGLAKMPQSWSRALHFCLTQDAKPRAPHAFVVPQGGGGAG